MNQSDRRSDEHPTEENPARREYAPPEIVWREPYDPVSFGISCAKFPANPGCTQNGPVFS